MLSGIPTPALAMNANLTTTSEGWRLSPTDGWSCDQVCSAEGLSCSEAGQYVHNGDVSTWGGMAYVMSKFGKRCSQYSLDWRTSDDVPCQHTNGVCYISTNSRNASQYNCSTVASRSRLCWCGIPGL